VPRKNTICETRLKNRGVFGNFKGNTHEWTCDIFPVDHDVLSMELPLAFRDVTVDEDPSSLYAAAQALAALQDVFGPVNRFSGQGRAAKQVLDLLRRIRAEQGAPEKAPGIDHLVVLDRGVDLLSPMLTQLTYEGLIDEFFGINFSELF